MSTNSSIVQSLVETHEILNRSREVLYQIDCSTNAYKQMIQQTSEILAESKVLLNELTLRLDTHKTLILSRCWEEPEPLDLERTPDSKPETKRMCR